VDIVDNRGNFDSKVKHLVDIVVRRIGLEIGDRFKADSRKVKFVVKGRCRRTTPSPSSPILTSCTTICRRALEDCSLELGSVAAAMVADGLTP